MTKHTKVMVQWVDIAAPGPYWAPAEESGLEKCTSLGFFVRESETELCIAQSLGNQDLNSSDKDIHYGGLLSIPRSCVLKLEEI